MLLHKMCSSTGLPPHTFHFFVGKILGFLREVAAFCAWPWPAAISLTFPIKTVDVTLLLGCISCNCWCLVVSLGCPGERNAVKWDSPLRWERRVGKRTGRSLTRADKIAQQQQQIQKSWELGCSEPLFGGIKLTPLFLGGTKGDKALILPLELHSLCVVWIDSVTPL